jgi:hypothetical protein
MASTDARPVPIKNTAYRVMFPIYDNTGALVPGAAGLDSEVSKDQGTYADCTNEATEIATSSGTYYLDLTATEMNADGVAVIVKTSTTDAKTTFIVLYPQESGDIKVDVQSAAGTAWLSGAIAAAAFAANAINASKLDPDVTTELQNGLATALALSDVETIASAISAKTTNLPSDPADASVVAGLIAAVETKVDAVDTVVDAILVDTAEIGAAGAGLTALASAANLATVAGYLDTEIAAILADTNELQTDWANGGRLDLLIDAIKAKTDLVPAAPAAVGDIPTAAANAAALMDLANGIETSITPRQALRLMLAASAGKLSGAATTTIVIRNVGDSKDRITATVDSSGNRSAVTVDAT